MVPIQKIKRFIHKGSLSHSKTFGSVSQLPTTLGRIAKYFKDQSMTNYCTAAARSTAGSYLWEEEMSFEFQTAKEGEVAGQPIFIGADPNTADKASEEYGFLPQTLSPLSFVSDGWTKPALWQNYPAILDTEAYAYTGFSPFNVYPDYNSIKQALFQGKDENAVVIANGFWYNNFNTGVSILPMPDSAISRHSWLFIDWKQIGGKEYLVAQLSQGIDEFDGGLLYFSEEVLNAAFKYPAWNGLGATIYRKGGTNPIQTTIGYYQQLIVALGEIYSILKEKLGYVA